MCVFIDSGQRGIDCDGETTHGGGDYADERRQDRLQGKIRECLIVKLAHFMMASPYQEIPPWLYAH
jgi:hypothetical protein